MELVIELATEDDIPELTRVMTRAFDDDARRHFGVEKGGPEGYDNGDFFRKWMLPYKESVGYKVTFGGQVIAGMIVWIFEHGDNVLGTIFVDPDYQRRGVGRQMWQFVERMYPETRSWMLETPAWASSNHSFYEMQCGFTKEKEELIPEFTVYVYRKAMQARKSEEA